MKHRSPPPALPKKKNRHYLLQIALYAALCLLLMVPTYLAVAGYILQKNAPQDNTQTVYLELSMLGPSGHQVSANTDTNKALFSLFVDLLESGAPDIAIPATHQAGKYDITMKTQSSTERYSFYFCATASDCYFENSAGEIRRSQAEEAADFLNSPYAFELYSGATLPVLTTAATDEVIPASLTWHYRTQKGAFTELSGAQTASELLTYPIANDIAFYFSVQPSHHEVIIRRAGAELYRGPADGISLTLQNRDEILDFEINAIYNQDSRLDYYGTLVYRFRMQVVEAAHFIPNTQSTTAGGYFLLRCENVKNAQKLQISATPTLPAAPILFEKDGLVFAAIPAPEAGAYTLRVTYGTIAAEFRLSVTSAGFTDHTPDTAKLGDWVTLLQRLPVLIAQKGAAGIGTLTPGQFLSPTDTRLFAYGDTVTVPSTTLDHAPLPFDLYRTSGEVRALCAGQVLEIGSDATLGNYIIVDHGYGLYTWYCGLSECRKNVVGSYVAVGEVLGLGSTTLYREESVLVMATLGKAAVSIDFLCQNRLTWQ